MTFDEWWYDYRCKNGIGNSKPREDLARAGWDAALAQRPEAREPVAWLSKDHAGVDLAISDAYLKKQPEYAKELWKDATPLFMNNGGDSK